MKTIKLQFVETQKNDRMTKDTYVIADSDYSVTEFSFVHDAVEYVLPEGYSVGETVTGEIAIFDHKNEHCELDAYGVTPRLSSITGQVLLSKASK
ncbi:hypothetical protein [Paenibacillus campinasensis]|uniref:Uncharacterized protein n=1 Tax=Paenibacillus campinasensis TaxID=66347 RepID=A0A268EH43_9BACL|nr:hypothetical protein [Paenibacillus campinasensis]PAD72433.1 hypothetical protein CHH67_22595 [Paenibacillus campinasensis]